MRNIGFLLCAWFFVLCGVKTNAAQNPSAIKENKPANPNENPVSKEDWEIIKNLDILEDLDILQSVDITFLDNYETIDQQGTNSEKPLNETGEETNEQ